MYERVAKEVRMFVSYFSARCESGLGVLNDIGTLEAAAAPAMNMQKTRGVGKEKSNNARKSPNILPGFTTERWEIHIFLKNYFRPLCFADIGELEVCSSSLSTPD